MAIRPIGQSNKYRWAFAFLVRLKNRQTNDRLYRRAPLPTVFQTFTAAMPTVQGRWVPPNG